METSTPLKIRSAKELLATYQKCKREEKKNQKKADRIAKNILKILRSIPSKEAQLYKENIDAITKKL